MPLRAEDLIIPAGAWADETEANDACRGWCDEVNAQEHSTIAAVPNGLLEEERKLLRPLPELRPPLRRGERRKVDKLSTIRIGSARYSVPNEFVRREVEGHRHRRRGAHRAPRRARRPPCAGRTR